MLFPLFTGESLQPGWKQTRTRWHLGYGHRWTVGCNDGQGSGRSCFHLFITLWPIWSNEVNSFINCIFCSGLCCLNMIYKTKLFHSHVLYQVFPLGDDKSCFYFSSYVFHKPFSKAKLLLELIFKVLLIFWMFFCTYMQLFLSFLFLKIQ